MAFTFRRDEHIRRRIEFEATYSNGAKINSRWMTLFVRPNGLAFPRLGVAATRKIGGAVVRNRAKRRARELFRLHKPQAGVDIVIIPRREFAEVPFASVVRDFGVLLERAQRPTHTSGSHVSARSRGTRSARADTRV